MLCNFITSQKHRSKGFGSQILQHLQEKNIAACFEILLKYYDKYYEKGLHKRENWKQLKINIPCTSTNEIENANKIVENLQHGK